MAGASVSNVTVTDADATSSTIVVPWGIARSTQSMPAMGTGLVETVADVAWPGSLAATGGKVYVTSLEDAWGGRANGDVQQIDVATGTVTASAASTGCSNTSRSYEVSDDGAYLYAHCAANKILQADPTGHQSGLFSAYSRSGGYDDPHKSNLAIYGTNAYFISGENIYRIDLKTLHADGNSDRAATMVVNYKSPYRVNPDELEFMVDETYAWQVGGLRLIHDPGKEDETAMAIQTHLTRVDLTTGVVAQTETTSPIGWRYDQSFSADYTTPMTAISEGDYIYADLREPNQKGTERGHRIVRIHKYSGTATIIAGGAVGSADGLGSGAMMGEIFDLASDGTNLYVLDTGPKATAPFRVRRVSAGESMPQFDFDVPNGISANTLFIPSGDTIPGLPATTDLLVWNPQSGLCEAYCEAMHTWRQQAYENEGSYTWWHAWKCTNQCQPEDFERDLIAKIVAAQGLYDSDGRLLPEVAAEFLEEACWANADNPTVNCSDSAANIPQRASQVDRMNAVEDAVTELLSSVPGLRKPLTPQQKAAKEKLEEIARKACADVKQGQFESAQKWGSRVHSRFEELVKQSDDLAIHGETGYLKRAVVGKSGNAWPKGTAAPDAVYGAKPDKPEMLFDLKTGFKGITASWLTKLKDNLPLSYLNVPVFRLSC